MEKGRNIWHRSRSLLGLGFLCLFSPLKTNAKEIFNLQTPYVANTIDYSSVKTLSFFFFNVNNLDVDTLVKSIAKEKAEVIITGKESIHGEALSPSIYTYIRLEQNHQEKACLISIDSCVNAVATKIITVNQEPLNGSISISNSIIILTNPFDDKEIENAISQYIQTLLAKIPASAKSKPKLFVVH